MHYEGEQRKRGTDFDVLLLRSVRKGESERDELVSIDDKRREAFKTVKAGMESHLAELDDRELRLAVLAELVDEFLAGRDQWQNTEGAGDADEPHQVQLISGGGKHE